MGLNTAAHTGVFDAVPVGAAYKRANILRKIGGLEREIAESRPVQKRGKQMSRKIVLNSKVRSCKTAMRAVENQVRTSQ